MSARVTADQARGLLDAVTTARDGFDAPPWREVGPQEHRESDLDTRTGRYGPMPREVAELAAAAPELAETVAWLRGRETDTSGFDYNVPDAHYENPAIGTDVDVADDRVSIDCGAICIEDPDHVDDLARALLAAAEALRAQRTAKGAATDE